MAQSSAHQPGNRATRLVLLCGMLAAALVTLPHRGAVHYTGREITHTVSPCRECVDWRVYDEWGWVRYRGTWADYKATTGAVRVGDLP